MKNLCLLLFISCMSVASLCFSNSEEPNMNKAAANPVVLVKTNKGDIKIELYPDKAPITVKNFLQYVQEGFYTGTIFHRVIPGFMVQGGGFDKNMKQKATHGQIKIESDNGLKNDRGTIAMARTSVPDSATAQFFINSVDNNMLNFKDKTSQGWGYTVFGKVTEGMNVVDEIIKVKTANKDGHQNVPVVPVEITEVTVVTGK
jgi:peptidyl-prolyl cis-trans isomerase B (cyclophilin B)